MSTQFVKIERSNGEIFYFNVNHVTMIFDNPGDKKVVVTGTGFEKIFRPDEAKELLAILNALTVHMPPEEPAADAAGTEPAEPEPASE
jgi:hypothetical protein